MIRFILFEHIFFFSDFTTTTVDNLQHTFFQHPSPASIDPNKPLHSGSASSLSTCLWRLHHTYKPSGMRISDTCMATFLLSVYVSLHTRIPVIVCPTSFDNMVQITRKEIEPNCCNCNTNQASWASETLEIMQLTEQNHTVSSQASSRRLVYTDIWHIDISFQESCNIHTSQKDHAVSCTRMSSTLSKKRLHFRLGFV
jgi:hypothetical protein